MNIQKIIQVNEALENSKSVVERLVEENLKNKMASYLKKFDKEDAKNILEIKVEKNKKELYNAVIQANFDGNHFRYEREDYKNLDDLINNLFEHFKETLSSK